MSDVDASKPFAVETEQFPFHIWQSYLYLFDSCDAFR